MPSRQRRAKEGDILWMDEILHQFETMGNRLFVGILHGNHHSRVSVVQDFVHPQYFKGVWFPTSAANDAFEFVLTDQTRQSGFPAAAWGIEISRTLAPTELPSATFAEQTTCPSVVIRVAKGGQDGELRYYRNFKRVQLSCVTPPI